MLLGKVFTVSCTAHHVGRSMLILDGLHRMHTAFICVHLVGVGFPSTIDLLLVCQVTMGYVPWST